MTRIVVTETRLEEIVSLSEISRRWIGGLLIGTRRQEGVWIERLLPCPNAAGAGEAHRAYRIDPSVVPSVRRALGTSPAEIVGFFHAPPPGQPEAPFAECAELAGPVWLTLLPEALRRRPVFRWIEGAGTPPVEVEVRVVREIPARAGCPE